MTEPATSSPATVTAPASDTNFAVETHDDGANRIVFVRHGQTDYNVERRFQGVIDRLSVTHEHNPPPTRTSSDQ